MSGSLVHPGDVVAAIKTLHGRTANLVDYKVLKGTSNVQGFMSCILRVSATCTLGDDLDHIQEVSFVIKRLPVMQVQQDMARDLKVFDQEENFFTKCLPLLRRKCPDLKFVHCLFAHSASTIVMEDLNLSGFRTIHSNFDGVKKQVLPLELVKMVMRELAKFHAASQSIDWLKLMPDFFEQDIVLEIGGGHAYKRMINGGLENNAIPIIKHLHQNDSKYADFLSNFDENVVPILSNLFKANPRYLNALCHGDCWTNNFMVRVDPVTEQPLDVRFIDLQVSRYAPACSDLQYFLHLSTRRSFRSEHLHELLRIYVEAFNAHANVTPDLLTLDKFTAEFEETRFGGALLAASMLPMGFIGGIAPPDGHELTEENFLNLLGGGSESLEDKQRRAVRTFVEDDMFRSIMKDCIADLTEQMDKLFSVKNAEI